MVRKLKNHFNKSFDEQYRLKADVMRQINDWRDSLKNVLSELGTMDKNEKAIIEKRLDWSPSEDPELDLPTAARESINVKVIDSFDKDFIFQLRMEHPSKRRTLKVSGVSSGNRGQSRAGSLKWRVTLPNLNSWQANPWLTTLRLKSAPLNSTSPC